MHIWNVYLRGNRMTQETGKTAEEVRRKVEYQRRVSPEDITRIVQQEEW